MEFSTVLSIRLMNLIDKVVLLFGIKWLDYTVCHLTVVIVCSILYFLPNRTLCIEERQYTRQGWYIHTHIYVCIRLLLKMKVAQDLWWSKIFVVWYIFLETFHFEWYVGRSIAIKSKRKIQENFLHFPSKFWKKNYYQG